MNWGCDDPDVYGYLEVVMSWLFSSFLSPMSFFELLPSSEPELLLVGWLLLELLYTGRAFILRGIKASSCRMVDFCSQSLGWMLQEVGRETCRCKDNWAERLTRSSLLASSQPTKIFSSLPMACDRGGLEGISRPPSLLQCIQWYLDMTCEGK